MSRPRSRNRCDAIYWLDIERLRRLRRVGSGKSAALGASNSMSPVVFWVWHLVEAAADFASFDTSPPLRTRFQCSWLRSQAFRDALLIRTFHVKHTRVCRCSGLPDSGRTRRGMRTSKLKELTTRGKRPHRRQMDRICRIRRST